MIVGKIAKAVLKLILPDVTEHLLKIFKLEKVLAYVELPNEADKGVRALKDELDMVKGELKEVNKVLHDTKDIMKKLKNKKMFKSIFDGK
jgi:hypothetical protein